MDTKCVDLLLLEAERSAHPVNMVIRGLSIVLQQPDIPPVLSEKTTENMEKYTMRRGLLEDLAEWLRGARDAVVALQQDGHPELPSLEVNAEVISEIESSLEALEAALASFKLRPQTVTGTFGAEGDQHSPRADLGPSDNTLRARDHAGDD